MIVFVATHAFHRRTVNLDGIADAILDPWPRRSGTWRSSILLVAGDKAGQWNAWYREAIPLADQRYETYLKERAQEEGASDERLRPLERHPS